MIVRTLARVGREKRRIVVPLVAAVVANLLLAGLVVYPLSQRVQSAEARATAAAAGLQAAEREHAAAVATKDRKDLAQKDLAQFYAGVLPAGMSQARRQTYVRLATLASDADLRSQRRLEELQEPRGGGQGPSPVLTRLEITMVLRGEYDSVRQFIRDVEASDEFIAIDHVSLVEGSEPGSPLVLTVVLSTYFKADGHGR
jgi:exopolyphosphatase/pppGpp-phosphohydrolase